jgi:hypothetical protein
MVLAVPQHTRLYFYFIDFIIDSTVIQESA